MLGELTPCGGGAPIPLFFRRIIVGRQDDCDVTIAARSVSSKHCELSFDGTQWHLRDMGSRNGTAVNGDRVVFPGVVQVLDEGVVQLRLVAVEPASAAD